jgi:hypothetical protein
MLHPADSSDLSGRVKHLQSYRQNFAGNGPHDNRRN